MIIIESYNENLSVDIKDDPVYNISAKLISRRLQTIIAFKLQNGKENFVMGGK